MRGSVLAIVVLLLGHGRLGRSGERVPGQDLLEEGVEATGLVKRDLLQGVVGPACDEQRERVARGNLHGSVVREVDRDHSCVRVDLGPVAAELLGEAAAVALHVREQHDAVDLGLGRTQPLEGEVGVGGVTHVRPVQLLHVGQDRIAAADRDHLEGLSEHGDDRIVGAQPVCHRPHQVADHLARDDRLLREGGVHRRRVVGHDQRTTGKLREAVHREVERPLEGVEDLAAPAVVVCAPLEHRLVGAVEAEGKLPRGEDRLTVPEHPDDAGEGLVGADLHDVAEVANPGHERQVRRGRVPRRRGTTELGGQDLPGRLTLCRERDGLRVERLLLQELRAGGDLGQEHLVDVPVDQVVEERLLGLVLGLRMHDPEHVTEGDLAALGVVLRVGVLAEVVARVGEALLQAVRERVRSPELALVADRPMQGDPGGRGLGQLVGAPHDLRGVLTDERLAGRNVCGDREHELRLGTHVCHSARVGGELQHGPRVLRRDGLDGREPLLGHPLRAAGVEGVLAERGEEHRREARGRGHAEGQPARVVHGRVGVRRELALLRAERGRGVTGDGGTDAVVTHDERLR